MKILIVGDTYYPQVNGCSYFTQRLAYYMQAKGHTVAVTAPSRFFKHTDEVVNGVRLFGISSIPVLFYQDFRFSHTVLLKSRMKKIIDIFEPDVIHLQGHFTISRAKFEVANKMGIPIVGTNHFMPENLTHYLPFPKKIINWVNEYMWKDFAKVFNKIPFITTPTEIAANLIRPRLSVPVSSITCGIDLEKFNARNDGVYLQDRYGIPKDKPVLLSVGRLDKEKRVDHVIRACVDAFKKTDFVLVVAGSGAEKKSLMSLAKDLNVSDKVIFTGFVPDEDLPALYAIADCFVTACTVELQCIVAMEAMATRLPLIAVRAGALPHLCEDGVNGALFEPGDQKMLTEKIVDIMSNKEKRKKMGEESLRMIDAHGINGMVEGYLEVYEKAIKNKKI